MVRISKPSRLLIFLALWTVFLSFAPAGGSAAYAAYADRLDTAYRLVDRAVQNGALSEKQGALLQAQILYRPAELPLGSPYRPSRAQTDHPRIYHRELRVDIARLQDQFTPEERQYLTSLHRPLANLLEREATVFEALGRRAQKPSPTAFARVAEALAQGKISPKEAVIAQATLLFAPEQLPLDSSFRPRSGEEPSAERCLTNFYHDVHRVFPDLTPGERTFLSNLDPDLANIMKIREQEALGLPVEDALPNYPGLDQTEEGTDCIVHYTDSQDSKNKILNADFPQKVKEYMDQAIVLMPAHFRKAYHEGDGKLHVYLMRMAMGTFGSTVSASQVDAKKRRVYIKITPGLFARGGADWQSFVRGTCFHEYHHGIQGAYNWTMSDWAGECLSEWASCYYAKWWWSPADAYSYEASIFNKPEWPLWYFHNNRQYSTSALAFFLGHRWGGYQIMKSWMEVTEVQNDAIRALNAALLSGHATDFRKEYRIFQAALYTKAIPSIRKIMPDIVRSEYNTYGKDPAKHNVFQTGARYYVMVPQVGALGTTLIAQFTPTPGKPGWPEAFILKNKRMTLYDVKPALHLISVRNFGSLVNEVAFIATDPRVAAQSVDAREYEFAVSLPYASILEVTPETDTVEAGQTLIVEVPLEVSGTYPTKEYPFTVEYWLKVGGVGDVTEKIEGLLSPPPVGLRFEVPTKDWYKGSTCEFTVQVRLPSDTWKAPQVLAAGQCTFQVIPPAAASLDRRFGLGKPGLTPSVARFFPYHVPPMNQPGGGIRVFPVSRP